MEVAEEDLYEDNDDDDMKNLFLLALVKKKELVKRMDMKAADEDS